MKAKTKTKRPAAPMGNREFMNQVEEWPCWPVLPLKRRAADGPTCGFLFAMENRKEYPNDKVIPKVLLGNIHRIREVMEGAKDNNEFYTRYETADYPTLDALVADGWVVD